MPGTLSQYNATRPNAAQALIANSFVSAQLGLKSPISVVPGPTGFNKITTSISDKIFEIQTKVEEIFNGKVLENNDKKKSKFPNPLDYGLIAILENLASVDMCNIINYALSKTPGGKRFDPNDTSKTRTTFGRKIYNIQYKAYQIDKIIEEYYNQGFDLKNTRDQENVNFAQTVINKISQVLNTLSGPESDQLFNEPSLNSAFPTMSNFGNILENSRLAFEKYTDLKNIPNKEFRKAISYIEKTKQVCQAIMMLDKPLNILSVADTFAKGGISEQIAKLNKLLDPKKITNVINKIKKVVTKISNISKQLLKFVNIGRTVLKIAIVIAKILKIIVKFLAALPIPGIFTFLGLSTTNSIAAATINKKIDVIVERIQELNMIFHDLYLLCQAMTIGISKVNSLLQVMIINLQNCDLEKDSNNESVKDSLLDSASELSETQQLINDFINAYDQNSTSKNNTYGEYTIQIKTEELVDEGIKLKRRYGIAIDKNEVIVVESSPTFASLDSIIIEEVKMLLESKNLVKAKQNAFSQEAQDIIDDSLNFLDTDTNEDTTIETENLEPELDDNDNEEDDPEDNLGLNSFINKLKGGRRLRRRMRKMLAKKKVELARSFQQTDPSGKFSSKLGKKAREGAIIEAKRSAQEQIKIKKERIAILAATGMNPASLILIKRLLKEIKDLQKIIAKLDPGNPQAYRLAENLTIKNANGSSTNVSISENSISTTQTIQPSNNNISNSQPQLNNSTVSNNPKWTPHTIKAPHGSIANIPLSKIDLSKFIYRSNVINLPGSYLSNNDKNMKIDALFILEYYKAWKKQTGYPG